VWAVGDNGPAYRRPAGYGRFVSIGSFGLPEADQASWVAINPLNNLLYSSNFDDSEVTLRVYELAQDASEPELAFLGKISLFGPDGQPFGGRRIQGGCFAPNGHLFLVSDSSSGGGIYGFDVATGRQFLYHHVTNPGESEEGDTKLGSRNAFEFQGLGFQYLTSAQSSQTYGSLHLLVMERRVWSKNRVTVNHYAIDYS
jgi:hypothetical protein